MDETNVTKSNLDDAVIQRAINQANAQRISSIRETNTVGKADKRNFIIVGAGDGGCNIASAISKAIPECYVIAYNTSVRAMDNINAEVKIIPNGEDGSGKDRSYSQGILKAGAYRQVIESIKNLTSTQHIDYIIVTTTVDGGTGGGVSPMLAKFISDNIEIPVVILGVYPSLNEDATALYNTMQWQQEVIKTNLPYIVLDNNDNLPKMQVHEKVNAQAVEIAKVIAGTYYGETNISSIDNRDMFMLINQIGKRISVYTSNKRPRVGATLDETLANIIQSFNQVPPANIKGIGLFLKGPEDFIHEVDTALKDFRAQYGEAFTQYNHLEISNDVQISLVTVGSDVPEARLSLVHQRYNEIMSGMVENTSRLNDMASTMSNPMGTVKKKTIGDTMDLSALDL